jgi:hypothetical protein
VDDGIDAGSSGPVDLVIIIDNSCSMSNSIIKVRAATSTWVSKYGNRPEIRFALVVAPDADWATWNEIPRLFQDFTDPVTFNLALDKQPGATGSTGEPTLDALEQITNPNNPLKMTWRSGAAKTIVVYSDEEPQSYTTPITTANVAAQSCINIGIQFYIFTDKRYSMAWLDWNNFANLVGGTEFDIDGTATQIETALDTIIKTAGCQK